MTAQPRRAAHRKPRNTTRRGGAALTGSGLVVALWFGLTAPGVSPVAAPASRTAANTVAQTVLSPDASDVPAASGR